MLIEANIFRTMAVTSSARVKVAQILESAGGGVGRHAIDLVSALGEDSRFEVHLIHSTERMDERYRLGIGSLASSVRVQEVNMIRAIQPGRDLRSLLAIYRYLRQHGPFAAVHVHSSKACQKWYLHPMLSIRWVWGGLRKNCTNSLKNAVQLSVTI
jgi:hypothetical protein